MLSARHQRTCLKNPPKEPIVMKTRSGILASAPTTPTSHERVFPGQDRERSRRIPAEQPAKRGKDWRPIARRRERACE
jgi:hypothetical protein